MAVKFHRSSGGRSALVRYDPEVAERRVPEDGKRIRWGKERLSAECFALLANVYLQFRCSTCGSPRGVDSECTGWSRRAIRPAFKKGVTRCRGWIP